MTPVYFVARDHYGEPHIWRENPNQPDAPRCVLSATDVADGPLWRLITENMEHR